TTLLPCYGMAEATLAITFKPWREPYRTLSLGRAALSRDGRAEPPASADDELIQVSCGRPLEGTKVAILDDEGRELPERHLGEIALSGPSMFSGYLGLPEPTEEQIARGFRTGDLGFVEGGELFVTGRKKELIILSGENHHPAEIEWAAGKAAGVRPGRVAAFGIQDPGLATEKLCLVAEVDGKGTPQPGQAEAIRIEIRRQVREQTGLVVEEIELVAAGTIPVTTSGKIRRGAVRAGFRAG
ncbi:MAG TPA: AMP-binding protein, partial [Thermoanaerobaculia bacterium]|nr:AMP-binding protein [Thermoanaerobaculia bacterium]